MFLVKLALARLVGVEFDAAVGDPVLERLHPVGRFHEILQRERARADRTGDRLSVIAFTPRERETRRLTWSCLAKVLEGRLRLTDEAGWLDAQRIAAVLPATEAAGALTVADDVCRQFPDNVPPPLCTLYTYPGDWPLDDLTLQPLGAATAASEISSAAPLEKLFLRPLPFWKRSLDVLGASVGLVLLSPVLAGIAVAIKLTSPGPVLFQQRRGGLGGKPFMMHKFRTMVADAETRKAALRAFSEQDGPAFKIRNDPRITPLGRFLRCTSLDELPQLWNVLRGEMSLVGPRPLPCDESEACDRWQRRRLDVTPGLTCIWQVRGRSQVSFADWVRMDLEYIRSRSLGQDLKLLALTVPAVLLRKGAH